MKREVAILVALLAGAVLLLLFAGIKERREVIVPSPLTALAERDARQAAGRDGMRVDGLLDPDDGAASLETEYDAARSTELPTPPPTRR